MVCDAGGGTVVSENSADQGTKADEIRTLSVILCYLLILSSLRCVLSLQVVPPTKIVNKSLLTIGGDLCGAVYLDEAFDQVIRTYVGSDYDKLPDEAKSRMFENDWEFGAKRKYDGQTPTEEFEMFIPGYKPKKKGMFSKRPSSTITLTSYVQRPN